MRRLPTDNAGQTFVPRDGFLVVALSSFKGLGEINSWLLRSSSKVELVYTTLRDHYDGALPSECSA